MEPMFGPIWQEAFFRASECIQLFVNRQFVPTPDCTHTYHCREIGERGPIVYINDTDDLKIIPCCDENPLAGSYKLSYFKLDTTPFRPNVSMPIPSRMPRFTFSGEGWAHGLKHNSDLTEQIALLDHSVVVSAGLKDFVFTSSINRFSVCTLDAKDAIRTVFVKNDVRVAYSIEIRPFETVIFVLA